ncbi:MAG TPA: glutamine amidotransferase [Cellvibrio sp.]|nr:glutamine amidotransferase [Cellvibrio sp.]
MSTPSILLIQTGTPPEDIRTPEGDLSDWFRRAVEPYADALQVIRVFAGDSLPPPGAHRAAIITGSWAMVTERLDWSEATADWIRRAMSINMPLFGVCYGHQLMAHALGGQVDYHPAGIEVGCLEIERLPAATSDALASALPANFAAHLTHLQTVLTPPPGAQVLARSAHDPHQIIRYGAHAISTQFHPEFTASISTACVMRSAATLRGKGHNPEALLADIQETPIAQDLLRRFLATYLESQQ